MQEAKWFHTKQELKILTREANGYCLICHRPIRRNNALCGRHISALYTLGLEKKRVKIANIKPIIKEYTYHLYYKIVGHQIDIKDRIPKQDRTKNNIPKQAIEEAINKLSTITLPTKYILLHKDNQEDNLYLKKLLLHLVYLYIAYYIKSSNQFKSEAHFNATVSYFTIGIIVRNYFKRIYTQGYDNLENPTPLLANSHPRAKELILLFKQIDPIIKPIILKVPWL